MEMIRTEDTLEDKVSLGGMAQDFKSFSGGNKEDENLREVRSETKKNYRQIADE